MMTRKTRCVKKAMVTVVPVNLTAGNNNNNNYTQPETAGVCVGWAGG